MKALLGCLVGGLFALSSPLLAADVHSPPSHDGDLGSVLRAFDHCERKANRISEADPEKHSRKFLEEIRKLDADYGVKALIADGHCRMAKLKDLFAKEKLPGYCGSILKRAEAVDCLEATYVRMFSQSEMDSTFILPALGLVTQRKHEEFNARKTGVFARNFWNASLLRRTFDLFPRRLAPSRVYSPEFKEADFLRMVEFVSRAKAAGMKKVDWKKEFPAWNVRERVLYLVEDVDRSVVHAAMGEVLKKFIGHLDELKKEIPSGAGKAEKQIREWRRYADDLSLRLPKAKSDAVAIAKALRP